MKFAVVSGENGRSKVMSVREVLSKESGRDFQSLTGMEVDTDIMWKTEIDFSDLAVPPDGRVGSPLVDLGCPPGTSRWLTLFIRPNVELYAHRTDTFDFDTVLQGKVTILLDEGEMTFTPGDSVLIKGVRHGWRTGPEGAFMAVANFGIQPLPGEASS